MSPPRLRCTFVRATVCVITVAGWWLRAPASGQTTAAAPPAANAPTVELSTAGSEFVVTAARIQQPIAQVAAPVDRFDAAALREQPALNIDDALRGSPAFSLFRRTGSLTANPTAQGVSLRGLGPSGASRSLVLLDGAPLNDPFGGWIAWTKVPRLTLAGAEIVRGGGSGAWGNAALGGVVQVLSEPPRASAGALAIELGEYAMRRGEGFVGIALSDADAVRLGGRWFETDGFHQFAPAQRGSIDRPFDSEHGLLHGEIAHTFSSGARVALGGRSFSEKRGNGTPLQRNSSRENAGHARFEARMGEAKIEALAYAQRQHFASGFSSVNDARTSETPALDQFDVPATAYGASTVVSWEHAEGARTTAGVDVRRVSGETREDFLFSAASGFQRRREAGGAQTFVGGFLAHQRQLAPGWSGQAMLRVDQWRNSGGHRDEMIKATGASVRADRFAPRDDLELSPTLGAVWHPGGGWRVRSSAYRAFRVPTLNELYRPFRVGDVSTDANPNLAVETLLGLDLGAELTRGPWKFSFGGFLNQLDDAVANVTLSVTAAGVQRQRLNLDEVRVRGVEAGFVWQASSSLSLEGEYLLSDARVRAATVAPSLVGRRLAQVPRHAGVLRGAWRVAESWRATAGVRAFSAQFEDDENQLRLAPAVVADVGVTWTFAENRELSLFAENVFDEDVPSTRTRDGLVSYAAPRLVRAALLVRW